jgi:hypothetical protein
MHARLAISTRLAASFAALFRLLLQKPQQYTATAALLLYAPFNEDQNDGSLLRARLRLTAVAYSKCYFKNLEYEYRVKTTEYSKTILYLFSHSIFRVVLCLLYTL